MCRSLPNDSIFGSHSPKGIPVGVGRGLWGAGAAVFLVGVVLTIRDPVAYEPCLDAELPVAAPGKREVFCAVFVTYISTLRMKAELAGAFFRFLSAKEAEWPGSSSRI